MHCVTFPGVMQKHRSKLGFVFTKTCVGNIEDPRFFENNFGPGKFFPGGPTCTLRGKVVPCFIRLSLKGSMTNTMPTNVFREMDDRKIFNLTEGRAPFVLLDGYGSRTELEFMQHVNDLQHLWTVRAGVPHGTSLWQVIDSSEN